MTEKINNNNVKVTQIILKPKEDTGFHHHTMNYVIIPITSGKLKLIDENNKETFTKLMQGEPYYREKGVKHNVINIDNKTITFIEVEIKSIPT